MRHRITTALRTDIGKVREGNEDAVTEDAALGLLVLADGMGGHNAGEVASEIAVKVIVHEVRKALADSTATLTTASASPLLHRAFVAANAAIYAQAQAHPQYRGMGTTAVTALLCDDGLAIAHVGDSRLYRLRAGRVAAVTRDHSRAEELVALGRCSHEEAARAGLDHILTRALGIGPALEIDLIEETLARGDIILLCSDGLSDMVDPASIERLLRASGDDLAVTAAALVDAANQRGGRDNISVALARVDAVAAPAAPWWQRLLGGQT